MITDKGTGDSWIARNYAYKQIILEGNYKLGQKVNVKVFDTSTFDLKASEN